MKISKIEFENFRNFKDHGEIRCATDGKVTIVYGKNGDGKTTLHQLLQWIIYGQVHFNKTTNDHLYNLQFEKERSFGEVFKVIGRIDFEHEGIEYSLTRTSTYKKELQESKKIAEDLSLLKKHSENDWKPVEYPKELIEKMLPSGLSEYFFFDGESMIADLRVKGRDSAGKLRKALYSMFDLDILESAIGHIGRTDLKTTVLGKLYLSKGTVASGGDIAAIKTNIENAQAKLNEYEEKINNDKLERKQNQNLIAEISERIGKTKSKSDYERTRKNYISARDQFIKNVEMYQASFGDAIMDMFPQLFISKAVADAKKKIHLKVEESKLPEGLGKPLIHYLLSEGVHECICGNHIGEEERKRIEAYLQMMPPNSYTNLYDNFSKTAERWGSGYNKAAIERWIRLVLDNTEQAQQYDQRIHDLDEEEKSLPDIEDLVVARQNAEEKVSDLNDSIDALEIERKKFALYLKQQMKKFDALTQESEESKKVLHKIEIMERVSEFFRTKLEEESKRYSQNLQINIQDLLNRMLTSKRNVSVSSEFSVRVTDSFNDESKSEGQFAVVSFAYIGGILKMLKSEESLSAKEYPLVLDGPFSKLDPDQRQNVVDAIPDFAPQVVLFSKDSLQDVFDEKHIGRVWTIESNDEKNVATVKEGYLWS